MLSRLTALIRDYFGVSHREARGFLVLLVLSVLLLLAPLLYRYGLPTETPDTSAADERALDSLVALMKTADANPPDGPRYADNDRTTAERMAEPQLFRFDPNTVSVQGWQQLGLPRWLAERIDKYRSKGGRFRQKEDLLRIYDFPPDLYEQLEPYIQLPDRPATTFGNRNAYAQRGENRPFERGEQRSGGPERSEKPALAPFDINTADTTQLIRLRGIGTKLAGRIVKFRDALGGFASTEQYRDIYGLDSLALVELTTWARVQTPVRKIPINTASAEELDRHPFLSRRQAEVIVRYREQHGAFSGPESLRPIRILDAKTIEKLTPYLSF